MENELIIIVLEDWEGIYYNGELEYEGTHIRRRKLIELMRKHNTFNVKEYDLDYEGEEWIDSIMSGTFPTRIDELEEFILKD